MPNYVAPGVSVTYTPNRRIVNIGAEVKIPAVIGIGPTVLDIADEQLVRSSGSGAGVFDMLAHSQVVSGSIGVYSIPGQVAGSAYAYPWGTGPGSWSLAASGVDGYDAVVWGSGTATPAPGDLYYATYQYDVPSTQYDVQVFTDTNDVKAAYGPENASSGSLSLGANIALENGSPAVMCVQVSGSAYNATNFQTALDKLDKKKNIAYVVPLFTDADARSRTIQHCMKNSAVSVGNERNSIVGVAIGTSIDSSIALATAIVNKRLEIAYPCDSVTRPDAYGNTMSLDSSYVAALLAGAQCGMEKIIYPINGKVVVGLTFQDDQYAPYDLNRLGANGITVITSRNGIATVRHHLTTDPTSADTVEACVVAGIDNVTEITRSRLSTAYMGKGVVIDNETPSIVAETTKSIWAAMVSEGWIADYGKQDNPETGERRCVGIQDPLEPRKVRVKGSVKMLYPLVWINVDFTTYV